MEEHIRSDTISGYLIYTGRRKLGEFILTWAERCGTMEATAALPIPKMSYGIGNWIDW